MTLFSHDSQHKYLAESDKEQGRDGSQEKDNSNKARHPHGNSSSLVTFSS